MKKIFIIGVILCAGFFAQAQVNPHAIGLRFGGDGNINGAEISYQHGFSEKNRLELDLGFGRNKYHNRTYLAGVYHWDWNLTGGLNWYIGPGAIIGLYSYDDNSDSKNYTSVGIGGQIGLEFDFNASNAPILISIDARPMWGLNGNESGLGWGAALGLRYTW